MGRKGEWVLDSVAFGLHGLFHEMGDRLLAVRLGGRGRGKGIGT
jgi:hypothetical protein